MFVNIHGMWRWIDPMALEPMSKEEKKFIEYLAQKRLLDYWPTQ